MKFGINTYVWVSPCTTEAIKTLAPKVKRLGYEFLEIPVENPDLIDFKTVHRILQENDLSGMVCGTFGSSRNICSNDPEKQKQAKEYIKGLIKGAHEIDSSLVSGPLYSAVGKAYLIDEHERREEWKRSVDGIHEMADYALSLGVRLALEPINRYKGDMINIAEQGIKFLNDVGMDNIGLLLDTYHMHIEEKDSAKAILNTNHRLFHFHASENDRGIPGTGQVHWKEIALALQQINYSGVIVIESFTSSVPANITSCCLWNQHDSDEDIAEKGLSFLKGLLDHGN